LIKKEIKEEIKKKLKRRLKKDLEKKNIKYKKAKYSIIIKEKKIS
jgi:hypothetical protein